MLDLVHLLSMGDPGGAAGEPPGLLRAGGNAPFPPGSEPTGTAEHPQGRLSLTFCPLFPTRLLTDISLFSRGQNLPREVRNCSQPKALAGPCGRVGSAPSSTVSALLRVHHPRTGTSWGHWAVARVSPTQRAHGGSRQLPVCPCPNKPPSAAEAGLITGLGSPPSHTSVGFGQLGEPPARQHHRWLLLLGHNPIETP